MRPVLLYFSEAHLDEENKFTLDFSDQTYIEFFFLHRRSRGAKKKI